MRRRTIRKRLEEKKRDQRGEKAWAEDEEDRAGGQEEKSAFDLDEIKDPRESARGGGGGGGGGGGRIFTVFQVYNLC